MNRLQIRDLARKKLGEKTAIFWTDAELNQWGEDAQLDIVWKAKLKRTRGTFTITTDTARYGLTTIFPNLLKIVSGGVWVYDSDNTTWKKLEYRSKEDMDMEYPNWVNADAGTPIYYMYDTDEDILEIYPTPDTQFIGTDYGRVYYTARPSAMTTDASTPDLDKQGILHPAVAEYIVATGFESRGYGDLANDHWAKYYDKIKSYVVDKEDKEDQEIVMKNYRNI